MVTIPVSDDDELLSEELTGQPAALLLADWRRRVADIYARVRTARSPEDGWALWHADRSRLYRVHPMSPLPEARRSSFREIKCFPYVPKLRFAVDLEASEGPSVDVQLGADGTLRRRPIARTKGLAGALGEELTIYWIEGYGGGLFLPFRDATSGKTTFGGGRYLLDAIKSADLGSDADSRLILDFNFAYHPSCALNDAYVCPLAPPENTLPVSVEAGERL